MKRLLSVAPLVVLLTLLFAVSCPAAGAFVSTGDGTWVWQWPLPQGNDLYDITFAGGDAGWAVGAGGAILATADGGASWSSQTSGTLAYLYAADFVDAATGWAVGAGGMVVRTTDAGLTWTPTVSGAGDDLRDVSFASATAGWVLGYRWPGDSGAPYSSILSRTLDGGVTWTVQQTWDATQIRAIGFADVSTGWAVGDGGLVLRTEDGGDTWAPQAAGVTADLNNLCVLGASHVWVAGDGEILETTDGGATWVARSSSAPVRSLDFTSIAVGSEGRIAATGWYYPDEEEWNSTACGGIVTSSDGGATWHSRYDLWLEGGVLSSIGFSSASHFCAVGDTGAIVRSTDGGDTWTGRGPLMKRELRGVDFVDARHGWAVGAYYNPIEWECLILRTADGGATWTEDIFYLGGWGGKLSDVDFVSRQVGYAVGDAGIILRSRDGGRHWRRVHESRTGRGDLLAVDFVGRSRGWAVGTGGRILKTSDGIHWRRQRSRTERSLFDVSFATRAVGYVVGAGGSILKTSDGGATWRRQRSRTHAHLLAVDFVGRARGWAVGASKSAETGDWVPVVRRTVNGGRTWKTQTVPRVAFLTAVDFVDRNSGWIAADDGTVFFTEDGGGTWAIQDSGVADELTGLCALSRAGVWAVSSAGGIVRQVVP